MASGDLLKKLFISYQQQDHEGFCAVAMQLIDEEKQKNHHILARDLQRILENGSPRQNNSAKFHRDVRFAQSRFEKLPHDRERGTVLLAIQSPERYLSHIVLSHEVKAQVEIVLEEYRASAMLQTYGLQPRRKLLFCGPPGCGKTLCAEVISGELGLPLLYTRFDAVISSYLGETAANLRQVFEYAADGRWVVFFDEFDAIGKSRDNLEEHGELKRVVNTFLQLLDSFRSESLLIAATNHEGALDRALWRRFDDILYFEVPTPAQIHELLELKLRGFRHKNLNLEAFVPQMAGWSHADIERVCIEAMKMSLMEHQEEIVTSIFEHALRRQLHRAAIIHKTQGVSR